MKPRSLILAVTTVAIGPSGHAAEIVKANNGFALSLQDSWVNEAVPGPGDVAVFDSTLTSPAPKPAIGDSMTWSGIRGADTLAQEAVLGYSAGSILSIGAAGIVMESTIASRGINIGTNIKATADQTWSSVVLSASATAPGIIFNTQGSMDLGGHTITRTGDGRMNINATGSLATTFSNGTLSLDKGTTEFRSGTNASVVTQTFTVRVNPGATFITTRGSGLLETFNWNGNIQLSGGLWQMAGSANPVNVGGAISALAPSVISYAAGSGTTAVNHVISAPITGSANLSIQNTSPNPNHRIQLSGNNSAYSGTLSIDGASGARTVQLASSQAGSSLATWNIATGNSLEIAANVTLGNVAGAGKLLVTNSILTLAGANAFSGETMLVGATLGGQASLAGSVTASGTSMISPGNSPGTLGIGGSLNLQNSSVYLAEIVSLASMDLISLSSATSADLIFNGALQVALLNGFKPVWGDSFKLMEWNENYTVSGSPSFNLPALSAGLEWKTDSLLKDGTISVIPEPSVPLLALASLLALLRRRR